MGSAKVQISGLDKFRKHLNDLAKMESVKKIVALNGSELQRRAMQKAPVDTGDLQRSISLELSDNGLTATVEPNVHYAAYVEFGTRFMNAQPYMRPSLKEQEQIFLNDLRRLGLE